jgi:hypothetical protein
MLSDGHKGTKYGNDHSLPPGIHSASHGRHPQVSLHTKLRLRRSKPLSGGAPAEKPAAAKNGCPTCVWFLTQDTFAVSMAFITFGGAHAMATRLKAQPAV